MISRILFRDSRSTGTNRCPRGDTSRRQGWVLLETVLATGLLIVGLAVIGAQIQDSRSSVYRMKLDLQAMALAEMKLAELDLGLVELDSFDEVQEEEFGPRYPEFAWRLTTEETGLEGMFLLTLDVLFQRRDPQEDDDYREGSFDFDSSDAVFTVYAFRAPPQPVDLGEAFGMGEEEFEDLSDKLAQLGIPGLEADAFDLKILGKLDIEDLLAILPLISETFNIDIEALTGALPPGMLDSLLGSGLLDDLDEETSVEGESGS